MKKKLTLRNHFPVTHGNLFRHNTERFSGSLREAFPAPNGNRFRFNKNNKITPGNLFRYLTQQNGGYLERETMTKNAVVMMTVRL